MQLSLSEALQIDGDTRPLRTILVAPITFDPSIIDLFLALGYGGTVVITSPAVKLIPKLFIDAVHSHHVTTLQCTWQLAIGLSNNMHRHAFIHSSHTT